MGKRTLMGTSGGSATERNPMSRLAFCARLRPAQRYVARGGGGQTNALLACRRLLAQPLAQQQAGEECRLGSHAVTYCYFMDKSWCRVRDSNPRPSVYDTENQSWSALPPMPTPRGALAAVAVDNKIYVIGGAKIPAGMDLRDGLTPRGPIELLGDMARRQGAGGSAG
jgi:hypothetical protein